MQVQLVIMINSITGMAALFRVSHILNWKSPPFRLSFLVLNVDNVTRKRVDIKVR